MSRPLARLLPVRISRLNRAGGQDRECGAGPLGKGWGHRAGGRGWPGQGPPNQGGFGRGSSSPQTAPSAVRPKTCKGPGPKGRDSSVLTSGPLCGTGAAPRPSSSSSACLWDPGLQPQVCPTKGLPQLRDGSLATHLGVQAGARTHPEAPPFSQAQYELQNWTSWTLLHLPTLDKLGVSSQAPLHGSFLNGSPA